MLQEGDRIRQGKPLKQVSLAAWPVSQEKACIPEVRKRYRKVGKGQGFSLASRCTGSILTHVVFSTKVPAPLNGTPFRRTMQVEGFTLTWRDENPESLPVAKIACSLIAHELNLNPVLLEKRPWQISMRNL